MLSPKQDFSTLIYVLYLPFLWGPYSNIKHYNGPLHLHWVLRNPFQREWQYWGASKLSFWGKKIFFYANQVMKRSEMRCSSKGRIWVCVSLRAGEISKAWEQELRKNSNVKTRKGAECACFRCVQQRERAGTREIKSWEIRSEIEWSFTELLSHWKTDRTDVGKTELYLQRSDTSQNNEMASSIWAGRVSHL